MLAPWMESYDKPRHNTKKQRHHLTDRDLYSQSYGFSSIHAQMWYLNHKEGLNKINPEYSLEGLMLKLRLQYSSHMMQRGNSWEKPLMLGKTEEDKRRRVRLRKRWLGSIWFKGHEFEQTQGDSWGQRSEVATVHGVYRLRLNLATEHVCVHRTFLFIKRDISFNNCCIFVSVLHKIKFGSIKYLWLRYFFKEFNIRISLLLGNSKVYNVLSIIKNDCLKS